MPISYSQKPVASTGGAGSKVPANIAPSQTIRTRAGEPSKARFPKSRRSQDAAPVEAKSERLMRRGLPRSEAGVAIRGPFGDRSPRSGYWSPAFRCASISRFSSSGVSFGGSIAIVSFVSLPVKANGT
jgi:hypothetical protein